MLTEGPAHPLFPTLLSDPFYTSFLAPRVLWYVQQHHLSSIREGGREGGREGEVPAILRLLKVDLAKAEASNPYPDYTAASSSLPSSLVEGEDEAATAQHDTKAVEEEREKEGGKEGGVVQSAAEAAAKKEEEGMEEYMETPLLWWQVLLMMFFGHLIFGCIVQCFKFAGRWV